MIIEADYIIEAPVSKVQEFLKDYKAFFSCIPNIDTINVSGENIKLSVKPSLAFIKGNIEMDFTIVGKGKNKGKLKLKGKSIGSSFEGTSTLEAKPDGKCTKLHWVVDIDVKGLLKPIPESIIKASAKFISKKFFSNINDKFKK